MKVLKFVNQGDLFYNYMLEKVFTLLEDDSYTEDIDEIIEKSIVIKYLEDDSFVEFNGRYSEEEIQSYRKRLITDVSKYINSLEDESLQVIFEEINDTYINDFIFLLKKYKKFENISWFTLQKALDDKNLFVKHLLKYKSIVDRYKSELRIWLKDYQGTAELLIEEIFYLDNDHQSNLRLIYNNEERNEIILRYINSEYPSWNHLKKLRNLRESDDTIMFTEKVLFSLYDKIDEMNEEALNSEESIHRRYTMSFSITDEVPYTEGIRLADGPLSLGVSLDWMQNHQDNETLLNNYIYLFGVIDDQGRYSYHYKRKYSSALEKAFEIKREYVYPQSSSFELFQSMSILVQSGYYNYLAENGVRLENVIEYFFEEYLSENHNIKNFKLSMPTENSSFLEKCYSLMPLLSSVLTQFDYYSKYGEINLKNISKLKSQKDYSESLSVNDKKYIYLNNSSQKVSDVLFNFFSNQSRIASCLYTKGEELESFFYKVKEEKVKEDRIENENVLAFIDFYVKEGYLRIDAEGFVRFVNIPRVLNLKDLFDNEVISYWNVDDSRREDLDILIKEEVCYFESKLFTQGEINYFDYVLNDRTYTNGLKLRNKYAHSNPLLDSTDEKHYENYIILLNVFIIVVLKINDDLNIKQKSKR